MKHHIEHMTEDEMEHVGHSSDEDDFFSSLKSKKSKGTSELEFTVISHLGINKVYLSIYLSIMLDTLTEIRSFLPLRKNFLSL